MLPEHLRPQNLTPLEREFLRHKLEQDYRFFVRYFFLLLNGFEFQWNWHHDAIISALMRVIRGELKNLIINMPPRYGKTELVIVLFVAWCLARWSSARFIHLSYSKELALDNSSRIREITQIPEYQALWPVVLKADTDSKGLWKTQRGGGIKAGAAGGAVTGFGAGLPVLAPGDFGGCILIDDPLKPDDADSDTKRDAVNKKAVSTIQSRRNSRDTPIVVVMQRLHDFDYTGFLTEDGAPEKYEVVSLPALLTRDDGTHYALWPMKHTVGELQEMQQNVRTKFMFSAQYQQQPVPDDGEFFGRNDVQWYDNRPQGLSIYAASDYAETDGSVDGKDPDYTEHGIFGVDHNDNVYVLDWWSGQKTTDVWAAAEIELIKRWKPLIWARPGDMIGKAVYPFIAKAHERERAYVTTEWLSTSKFNKLAQARSFQGLWKSKKVFLPRNQPWAEQLLAQLTRFPKGRFDDKVDTCSHFGRLIDQVWAQEAKQPKKQVPITQQPTLNDWLKPQKKLIQRRERF